MTKHLSKRASELIVVTAGEPAGIGPELCLDLASSEWATRLVFIADPEMLAQRASLVGRQAVIHEYAPGRRAAPGELLVLPQALGNPAVCGIPDVVNSASLLAGLRRAVTGCLAGEFAALVTAPLQKSIICEAGFDFTGHTEYLAELTGSTQPVMLLVADEMRVALATTHLPLKDVPRALTTAGIVRVLEVLHADLQSKFRIATPEIIVCGLNPHAGEGGHLGNEEHDIIAPAVALCRAQGMKVRGPLPADTAFTPAGGPRDAVLAMYHDQGLPVIKFAGFGRGVNVTLGLPIIRTSVDHGTALDRAGTGSADAGSMLAAVRLAAHLAMP